MNLITALGATWTVVRQRFTKIAWQEAFRRRLPLLLAEIIGVALFASGSLTTCTFLYAQTPEEAVRKGLTGFPSNCEAFYLNHGGYFCWYTIQHHPLVFGLCLLALFGGAALTYWTKRHWSRWNRSHGS